ncbi:uncharacterized protein PITG_17654 [Phytophthora infestans T30-4]|uniref:Uncharacterized protein n=1 Tax=Phytophthora infestans (strain T30-4) TaxID=403677 RepID=D0NWJ8_PHYIT|nr:uncharacterized protein PITG_17654 [Phytophthora infestans T30-4]EEY67061.1 hypothetical protein PITG_17654 [Phytophthora infestans T30-4]|eukprot:XP_002896513.1 hypothetical protein PITG_17654 [Phytophthora infestans T30-4]
MSMQDLARFWLPRYIPNIDYMFSWLKAQRMLSMVAVVGHDPEGYELGRRALVVHGHFLDGHFGHEVCLVGLHDLSGLALEHDLAQHGRHASGSCEYLDTLKPEICTVPDSKDLGRLNEPLTSMSGTP